MIHTQDADFTLLCGDVLDELAGLADESVHCVVTSPPYWGLRDYGTGSWADGDPDCDHIKANAREPHERKSSTLGGGTDTIRVQEEANVYRDVCGKCSARRVDQQLGLEPTPELYVARMVEVFREVRRVLRADGTCWVNLGDSYYSDTATQGRNESKSDHRFPGNRHGRDGRSASLDNQTPTTYRREGVGLKPKDLCGIPWRVAFALQTDGWYLRSDIIWAKPNPMPESVTDRPTKAHEYVFLLSKGPRYFFDAEAIAERAATPPGATWEQRKAAGATAGNMIVGHDERNGTQRVVHGDGSAGGNLTRQDGRRNVRSVWDIATQPYPEAHFATYPEELVRRCVLAGSPADGTVLDPFLGSGTTAYVARKHGRRSIGIELNPAYADLAATRMQQQSLFA